MMVANWPLGVFATTFPFFGMPWVFPRIFMSCCLDGDVSLEDLFLPFSLVGWSGSIVENL